MVMVAFDHAGVRNCVVDCAEQHPDEEAHVAGEDYPGEQDCLGKEDQPDDGENLGDGHHEDPGDHEARAQTWSCLCVSWV